MKRIVYSIYNGCVEQTAISTNKYKLSQFIKYKDNLKETQRAYAEKCNAEYVLHETDITNYDSIQFEKIFLLEKYADEGITTIEDVKILKIAPFNSYGSPLQIISEFGNKKEYFKAVRELEEIIYNVG